MNEDFDGRVCSLNSYFDDDLQANCEVCQKTVYYRLYGPIDVKFLCTGCAAKELGGKK